MRALQILLAEDNRGDVLLIQESLREHQIQHKLYVVRDGQEALDYVGRMPDEVPYPDLVLLDLNLPKVDGSTVLSELRQHPESARVPVIVVTSSDSAKDKGRMAQLGISHYFRKPTEYEDYMRLGSIVKQVLEQQTA
jgi:chemotaxis family two-component system response regulator Rcp1